MSHRWKRAQHKHVKCLATYNHKRYNEITSQKQITQTPKNYMPKQLSVGFRQFFRRLSLMLVAGALVGSSISVISVIAFGGAQSIDQLRQQAAELDRQIEENSEQASQLADEANSLRNTIAVYDGQINEANVKINDISNDIDRLEDEIRQAEDDIEKQKELLKTNMRALYRRGGASTVELLVASDSFSEFMDEQEYLERLKIAIQDATNEVISLQEQLEEQKAKQEDLLVDQRNTKQELAQARENREALLAQTRGEEERYREMIEELKELRIEAEAAIASAIAAGSFRSSPAGRVSAGDVVGRMGNSGMVRPLPSASNPYAGTHLHLEVRQGDGCEGIRNPIGYIISQPVDFNNAWVSQGFGNPSGLYYCGWHPGIDYAGPYNSPIYAIDDGDMYRGCSTDILMTSRNYYGYVAVVEHDNGVVSIYAHLSDAPQECDFSI